MRDGQTFGYYVCVTKVYDICVRLRTQPKNFENLKCKKSKLLVFGKTLVIQFQYIWKNTNHRPFMQFSVLTELHEKCMISVFPYMKIVWLAFLVNSGFNVFFKKQLAVLILLFYLMTDIAILLGLIFNVFIKTINSSYSFFFFTQVDHTYLDKVRKKWNWFLIYFLSNFDVFWELAQLA